MNLKHAQYMLTVLKEGSITNAAKKLYISQPSLSQMIKTAETNLGTPIFNRSTDPLTLTYAGQKYIEAAQKILTINNNLLKEIEEINHEDHGKIILGIPVQRAMQVLPYMLPKFKKLYPFVKVQVEEHGSATTESMILNGSVDLACLTTTPKHEELQYTLVEMEEVVLLTSKNSNIARRIPSGTPIDIMEAKDEQFVCIKSGHSVRKIQEQLFVANDIQPDILLQTISIEVGKRTAVACDAVMLCPLNYIQMSPELLPLSSIYPVKGIEHRRNFYICYRKDRYLTKYMQDFVKVLTNEEQPFMSRITK